MEKSGQKRKAESDAGQKRKAESDAESDAESSGIDEEEEDPRYVIVEPFVFHVKLLDALGQPAGSNAMSNAVSNAVSNASMSDKDKLAVRRSVRKYVDSTFRAFIAIRSYHNPLLYDGDDSDEDDSDAGEFDVEWPALDAVNAALCASFPHFQKLRPEWRQVLFELLKDHRRIATLALVPFWSKTATTHT